MCSRLEGDVIAKYFFHLQDGEFILDREGLELPDWEAASNRALLKGAEAIRARGVKFWTGEHLRVIVTDSIGTALFELRLSGHLPLERNTLGPHEAGTLN